MHTFSPDFFEQNLPKMRQDLETLCAIPSVTCAPQADCPFGKEAYRALQAALEICKREGLITREIDKMVGEADLCEGEPVLGILCHLDVVAAGDGWRVNPYGVTLEGDNLVGRGVIDDKGPFVAVLYALLCARRLAKQRGIKLPNIRLIFGTDEECSSSDLAHYATKRSFPPQVFTPDAEFPLISMEKGRLHAGFSFPSDSVAPAGTPQVVFIKGGETVNAVPGTATAALAGVSKEQFEALTKDAAPGCRFETKVCSEPLEFAAFAPKEVCFPNEPVLLITCLGQGAHAALPSQGINALTGLLQGLKNLPLAKNDLCRLQALCKLFPFGQTDGLAVGLQRADQESGALTLAFSVLLFTQAICEGVVDIRFPVSDRFDLIVDLLTEALAKEGGKLTKKSGVEPHMVPNDSRLVQTLLAAYEAETGLKGEPMAIGGGTYVHKIEGGVAFGPMFLGKDYHMHGPNEFVSQTEWLQSGRIYANAIWRLTAQTEE